MSERQLLFDWDAERPSNENQTARTLSAADDAAPVDTTRAVTNDGITDAAVRQDADARAESPARELRPRIEEVAAQLRPRLIEYLREAAAPAPITELRAALGHAGSSLDADPQSNPVNLLLKQLRDRGEVVCTESQWGDPTFSLPAVSAAESRQLEAGSWERDVEQRFERHFVKPVIAHLVRHPWSTAADVAERAFARMRLDCPIRTAADILHKQRSAETVQIAWDADGNPYYALAGVPVPDRLATQGEIDAAGGEFPEKEGADHSAPDTPPPLVRPDRQHTFDGAPRSAWPKAEHDRDAISVDRFSEDIDGPAHRFVICRGDSVEAYFVSSRRTEVGEVVGISHARGEVSVRLPDGTDGVWFPVGCIYPAPPEQEAPRKQTFSLSAPTTGAENSPPNGGAESNPVSHEPYTMRAFQEYRERYDAGTTTLADHRAELSRLRATKDAFTTGLCKQYDAARLKALAARFGCFDAKRNTKPKNADHIYRVILQSFTLGSSVQYNPMEETLDDAVAREIEGLTDDDWQQHIVDRAAEKQENEQALQDPQTIEQFRIFIRENGAQELTDDQRIRFDELLADQSRSHRSERKATTTVSQISDEVQAAVDFTMKEGYHDRQECKLWIVQMNQRVAREQYKELLRKAKMLGGWYSSFKKNDAGFQFKSRESAEKFIGLMDGDADRTEELADRKARKMDKAGAHLTVLAETLEQDAEEKLAADADKLKNTVRRAEMAAGVRGQAYANQAMAGTYRRIAVALDAGEAKYLDGVRHGTQVAALVSLLRRGKTKRNQTLLAEEGELGVWDRHRKTEELDHRPILREDAAFAEYPFPSISRHHFRDVLTSGAKKTGLKQQTRRMETFAVGNGENHFIDFVDQSDIDTLLEYLGRCKDKGIDTQWIDTGLEDYKRMRAANIYTPQELRCALRELVPHLTRKRDDDPVAKAEQALIGQKIPGFFPTPGAVISRMLELAEIDDVHRVLEPSAGKGDILDMLREHHPDNPCTAIEQNGTLIEVIHAKGHDVEHGDFLSHQGSYDRIVMNPPFENSQDIEHVQHAFSLLEPRGRVVSVMSTGPFFRSDRKAEGFREWFDELGGVEDDLPEDAFKGVDAFRQTGVRTKVVVIDKKNEA